MPIRAEGPHVKVYDHGASALYLPLSAHDDVQEALLADRTFWIGRDLWGQEITLRLDTVACMQAITEDAIAIHEQEDAELKQRALIEGDG
jgi:hypothetical protein